MMPRVLEPELMENTEQVIAYIQADFSQPHGDFIRQLKGLVKNPKFSGTALDLGCGPGDISRRFAKAFPDSTVDAIDGSKLMVDFAKQTLEAKLKSQVNFIHGLLPEAQLPKPTYDIIFSNSLLHHMPEPHAFWQVVKRYSKPGTLIAVMDLLRPKKPYLAKTMVEMYAATEPEILQQDFFNSLLAAFTLAEIKEQLSEAHLKLSIEQISDRHVFMSGIMT